MGATKEGSGGVLAGGEPIGDALALFLVQVVVVICMTRILSLLLRYVHQPRVIAEVIGGILLGPSLMGTYVPGFTHKVFPKWSIPQLQLIANFGLVLYLFIIGIELDPKTMVQNANKTFLIAGVGIGLPFIMGWILAPVLYDNIVAEPSIPHPHNLTSFKVFICVAMSITAFPVLARIMNETKLLRTNVGITALSAAALDDVAAWSLLALSIALIHASDPSIAAFIFLSVAGYAIGMLTIIRPIWWKIVDMVTDTQSHAMETILLAFTFVLVFFSAWVTEALGVHAIFGAFLVGLIMPRGHPFTIAVTEKVEDIVQIVFLPLYFAVSGLKTNIMSLHGPTAASMLLLVIAVATAAKLIGCGLGARLTGLSWRESLTVGTLMNTRGLVELIVLNVGLEAKVINSSLFTIMVLMALTTTFMTTPMVALIYPPSLRKSASEETLAKSSTEGIDYSLCMVVERLEEIPTLTNLLFLIKSAIKGTLGVSALQYTESSSLPSDVIRAVQPDVAVNAPQLHMLKVFGQLMGAIVTSESLVSYPRHFASHLSTRNRSAQLTILPFKYKGREMIGDYHTRFILEALQKSSTTSAVLINAAEQGQNFGGLSLETAREVLLVLSAPASRNDVEAIAIVRQLTQIKSLALDVVMILPESANDDSEIPQNVISSDSTRSTFSDEEAKDNYPCNLAASPTLLQWLDKLLVGIPIREKHYVCSSAGLVNKALKHHYEFIITGAGPLPWDGEDQQEEETGHASLPTTPKGAPDMGGGKGGGFPRQSIGGKISKASPRLSARLSFDSGNFSPRGAERTRCPSTPTKFSRPSTPVREKESKSRREEILSAVGQTLASTDVPVLIVHAPDIDHLRASPVSLTSPPPSTSLEIDIDEPAPRIKIRPMSLGGGRPPLPPTGAPRIVERDLDGFQIASAT